MGLWRYLEGPSNHSASLNTWVWILSTYIKTSSGMLWESLTSWRDELHKKILRADSSVKPLSPKEGTWYFTLVSTFAHIVMQSGIGTTFSPPLTHTRKKTSSWYRTMARINWCPRRTVPVCLEWCGNLNNHVVGLVMPNVWVPYELFSGRNGNTAQPEHA